ncbi:MAG: pyruvate kinase [Opitutus sp.]|nr:pyruvate kinase [Opitutus sp.]MCS6248148.1 pyruvate kinase [Opitutus sp.]MCS6274570.1 pyruvate kinase [Opitutus sp.]MCS6277105.1 pyruvate kinase [Opitutus sp.]MCS6300227.1 pyruvate kinase [Opitutus sp.]
MSTVPSLRRTKIIFTLGPASQTEEMLEKLILAGADVARLNMAHGNHEWTRMVIRRIRAVSKRVGREIAIMMDIKGPEIRTGDVDSPIELKVGETFDFTVKPGDRDGGEEIRSVNVNYKDIVNDIKIGDIVLVDSGLMRFEVLEKKDNHIRCKVLTPGALSSRRHINLPGVKVNLPAFTEKDRLDTLVGIEEGIDFVALSFVREAQDIVHLRKFLADHNSKAKIIAKIEDQTAIANLDEIINETDALMVARGDLGIECPLEDLPVIQRRAVKSCFNAGKPVIIATHTLESMISSPVPTRAEITDVANAVYEKADCVMLSGETTVGKYPLECVQTLDRIARRIEQEGPFVFAEPNFVKGDKLKLLHAAVQLAHQMPDTGLLTFTRQGNMAGGLAALRPNLAPIYAMTNSVETLRQLRLLRSVEPFLLEHQAHPNRTVEGALALLTKTGHVKVGDKLIVATDMITAERLVDSIQLRVVI